MPTRPMFFALTSLACLAAAGPPSIFGDEISAPASFPELGLTIRLPDLEGFKDFGRISDQMRGKWSGALGEHQLDIVLFVVPKHEWGIQEPDGIIELVESGLSQGDGRVFRFTETDLIEGAYGYAPYAATGRGDLRSETGELRGTLFCMGGVGEQLAYSIEIECSPAADKAVVKEITHLFEKGVSYEGESWDYRWSDEEVEERWRRDAPDDLADELRKPVRTKHYVFLSNASGQDAFARKMEENYKKIKKIFPFPEVKQRKLMPVFLFRTPEQYYQFSMKVAGMSMASAQRTGGHAWRDYYTTWYEAPGDPTHLHEQVHQIFMNRLRLGGGGSWFQEGVAEYAETRKNQRSGAARTVKKERHTRLTDFVMLRGLIASTSGENIKGGSEAGDLYKQAALLIEFLRESKFGKKKFPELLVELGRSPQDLDALNAVFLRVYEVDLTQLDELFVTYCKKR